MGKQKQVNSLPERHWAGHHFISGPTCRDKQPFTLTFNPMGNFRITYQPEPLLACTQREPMQAQGEHENSRICLSFVDLGKLCPFSKSQVVSGVHSQRLEVKRVRKIFCGMKYLNSLNQKHISVHCRCILHVTRHLQTHFQVCGKKTKQCHQQSKQMSSVLRVLIGMCVLDDFYERHQGLGKKKTCKKLK